MAYRGSRATAEDQTRFDALARALAGRGDVELALVFGSRARGTARPDSDLDLAVLGRDLDLLELADLASRATGVEAHVVDLRGAGYPLLRALLRDAVRVHEGCPHAEAKWRTSAITRVELDRVWYTRMRDGFLRRLSEAK
ncbi:MAG: nucleotidyltransferase domain-containing protein [Holophagales bacterium]|nr:nucleotidyltransferase domain-containing protein [Holophagales bacterium]